MDFQNIENKESNKKITSKIKCKWFDPNGNKFTEKTFPIEVVEIVLPVNINFLELINDIILQKKYFQILEDGDNIVLKPNSVSHRMGKYYLKAYHYIYNKHIEIDISDFVYYKPNMSDILCDSFYISQAPSFEFIKKSQPSISVDDEKIKLIKTGKSENYLLRLKYKNSHGTLSFFTLKDYKLKRITENDGSIIYLTGYSFTHNEIRTFRIDRIEKLFLLNIKDSVPD